MILRIATTVELDAPMLYRLLRLRADVFVVEQQCPYPELDGRDLETITRHFWLASDAVGGEPLSYLRLLTEPDGSARIGRVCTAASARGQHLSGRLVAAALDLVGARSCVLDAQSHLVAFYKQYGFSESGTEFVEDGIPHTPMLREFRASP
jgi:ElaA protein